MPHLLFAGPPGSGKTTTAQIMARHLLGEQWRIHTLSLNASDERGIDIVRERVKSFANYIIRQENVPFRLVILDECDEMTNDAQTALRRIMEETSANTRFILVCNYSSGIIEPLQSRCAIFRFQRLGEEDIVSHLRKIASFERVNIEGDTTLGAIFEATQGDLRQAINLLQTASMSGSLTPESVAAITGTTIKSRVAEIVRIAIGGDFASARTRMIELTRIYGIPERDFLKFANEALVSMDSDDAAKALSIIADYDFRLVQGAQPELQLTAMLAQLATIKGKGE